MKLPVDIKSVLDAFTDTEQSRSVPVSVHVYVDDAAPDDLVNLSSAMFRSESPTATVTFLSVKDVAGLPDASADAAVVVAGEGEGVGSLVSRLRSVSVPTMILTLDPEAALQRAEDEGHPLFAEDVLSPDYPSGTKALAEASAGPLLNAAATESLCDKVGAWIVEVFSDKRLAFAAAFRCVRRPLSLDAVTRTSIQNAGVGLVVILPGADMPVMTLNQMKMLLQIAAAYGQSLDMARAKELAVAVGGAFACRAVARQLLTVVPGFGWAIKAGIGYAGTYAMGRAAIVFFEQGGDASNFVSYMADSAREAYEQALDPDAPPSENAKNAAVYAKESASRAMRNASHNIAPTAKSLAKAAVDATGLTDSEMGGIAGKLQKGIGSRFAGKH